MLDLLEKVGLMQQPLHTESLVAAARRQTGLDDFGDETFREPLSRLLASCATEARLNIFGRCALTQDVLQLLANRLQIQHDRGKWPQIREEAIIAPLFIVGRPFGSGPGGLPCSGHLGSNVSFAAALVRGKQTY
jgi:hypothetical protein